MFRDRREAGRILAGRLAKYAERRDLLVLGLPRGGVPVAYEVAVALRAPLDVFLVRKLGVPGQSELAMGAISGGGVRVLNEEVVRAFGLSPSIIDEVAAVEQRALESNERAYRGSRPALERRGRTAMLVDDGLATGSSMRAAIAALRREEPARIAVAVPVAAVSACEEIWGVADDIVCASIPEPFVAVGQWYEDFSPTTDDEVRRLLEAAATVIRRAV